MLMKGKIKKSFKKVLTPWKYRNNGN